MPQEYGSISPPRFVVLVGLRGSGKSTVSRGLAARLGVAHVDLDEVTPRLLGFESVAAAWAGVGEGAFRVAEVEALRGVIGEPMGVSTVVALGGGTPTAPGAAALLREARRGGVAVVVYLRARPETLRARLEAGTDAENANRPALTEGPGTRGVRAMLDEVPAVFAARDPLYVSLADHVIETDAMTSEATLERLVSLIRPG